MLKLLKKLEEKPLDALILRLFSSWAITATVCLLIADGSFTEMKSFSAMKLSLFIIVFAVSFGIISLVCLKKRKSIDRKVLPFAFGLYAFFVTLQAKSEFFFGLCISVLSVIIALYYYGTGGLKLKKPFTAKKRNAVIITAVVVSVLTGIAVGILRYVNYLVPNYDFGIFCQMFHNMRESFSPVTTCERDRLLSHFAVHVSPIYYLMLPFYYVFPSPITLQISQTVILASAVIPAYLLCRHFKLSDSRTAAVSAITVLQPVVINGTFYDLHENCFLFPLLLWLFWAFEKNKYLLVAVFSVLTLSVKEDAAIYIAFFAIYVILGRRKYLTGVSLLAVAAIWFISTTYFLSKYGDGVMTGRYDNYLGSPGTLVDVVKNVLVNPGYVFTQLFLDNKGGSGEKTKFLLQLFAPLAFLPFVTKKVSRFLLLLPVILINFMTLYPYQYQLSFQYAFGSAAFITFLMIMNLADLKGDTQKLFAIAALLCSVSLFVGLDANQVCRYNSFYAEGKGNIAIVDEYISRIPNDASVCASTYLVPHMSKRSVLYEDYYHEPCEGEVLDYIIIDARFKHDDMIEKFNRYGYEVTENVKNGNETLLVIMRPTEKTGKVGFSKEDEPNTNAASNDTVSEKTGEISPVRAVEGAKEVCSIKFFVR